MVLDTATPEQKKEWKLAMAKVKQHTTSTYLRLPKDSYFEDGASSTTNNEHKAVMQVSLLVVGVTWMHFRNNHL